MSWPEAFGDNLTNVLDSGHRGGEANTASLRAFSVALTQALMAQNTGVPLPLEIDSAERGVPLTALCLRSLARWFLTVEHFKVQSDTMFPKVLQCVTSSLNHR